MNHMVRNGYTREEIEKVRQGLKTFGWRTDPSLPPGFLTRCRKIYPVPESASKLKLNVFVLAMKYNGEFLQVFGERETSPVPDS